MTVRINKSAFNIREKLSELERPIGLKGSELMGSETVQEARDFVSAGRKNFIMNGDFKIWQRGTSGGLGNGNRNYKSADRWFNFNAGDTTSRLDLSSENIGGVTGRFRYGMRVSGSQSSRILGQCVEGPLPAGDYVFSAWVRFSEIPLNFYMTHNSTALTGENNFAGWYGGSGTSISYTKPDNVGEVVQTGVWYKVYKKFTAVSPHLGLGIAFQPVFGASTAATMDITGVQLEVGKNATDFEHRSYGEELALCERYFQLLTTENEELLGVGYIQNSTSVYVACPFRTTMRTVPTIYNTLNGTVRLRCNSASADSNSNSNPSLNSSISSQNIAFLSISGFSGLTGGQGCTVRQYLASSGLLGVNAEL